MPTEAIASQVSGGIWKGSIQVEANWVMPKGPGEDGA